MKLPEGYTEEQILALLNQVLNKFVKKFKFGYYAEDDIRQEGLIIGIKCLNIYNPEYDLKNFLYAHIYKRLINFVRDNHYRKNPPCSICSDAYFNDTKTTHPNGEYCYKYLMWQKRNNFKKNMMKPLDIDNFNEERDGDLFFVKDTSRSNMISKEIYDIIELKIPMGLRKYFLQLSQGINISPYRKKQLIKIIREILTEEEMGRLMEAFSEEATE